MAVCGPPSVATADMLVGLFRPLCTVLWKLAGREGRSPPFTFSPSSFMVSVKGFFCGAFRKLASAPSPFPSTPWHCAQTRSKTLRPSAAEGIRGRPCSLATIGAASNDTSRSGRLQGSQDEHPHYQENGGRKSVHAVPCTVPPAGADFLLAGCKIRMRMRRAPLGPRGCARPGG